MGFVVADRRIAALQRAADRRLREVVRCNVRIILQRQVWSIQLKLLLQRQKQPAGPGGLRPNVRMAVGVGNDPVDIAQKALQLRDGLFIGHSLQKRIDQLVQISQIHRLCGDGRNVAIQDLQRPQQLVQIFGRVQFQEPAALLHEPLKVHHHIARAVWCVSLIHIANCSAVEIPVEVLRQRQYLQGILRLMAQSVQLLMIIQMIGCNDIVHSAAHGFSSVSLSADANLLMALSMCTLVYSRASSPSPS